MHGKIILLQNRKERLSILIYFFNIFFEIINTFGRSTMSDFYRIVHNGSSYEVTATMHDKVIIIAANIVKIIRVQNTGNTNTSFY